MNGATCININALFQVSRGFDRSEFDRSAIHLPSDTCACKGGYYGDNCEHEAELLLSESEQLKRRHVKNREAKRINAKRKEATEGKLRNGRSTKVTEEIEMDLEGDFGGHENEAECTIARVSHGDYFLSQLIFVGLCMVGFMVVLKRVNTCLRMAMRIKRHVNQT